MATTYFLECTSGGAAAELKLIDSLMPGADTWEGTGGVSTWGDPAQGSTSLMAGSVLLRAEGLLGNTIDLPVWPLRVGSAGVGEKLVTDGEFPTGEFKWLCRKIR